ncbi:hypothetical protein CspHIS471_0601560 [Cutaneotrichosporon sp. HIS471]|nr:hypothetical protein CspHIS471_0601560 [Cutaneotrichosporon sp. HIS471]
MQAERENDNPTVEDEVIQDEEIAEVVDDDGMGEPMDDDDMDEDETMELGEEELGDNSIGSSSVHEAQKSVFALHAHPSFPNPPLAVSGGEDDLAYIFAPLPEESGAAINGDNWAPIKLDGHSDSVVAVEFSHDGEMVATAGMDGKVRVWKRTSSGEDFTGWAPLAELDAGSEVQWLHWHPRGPVVAAGCEDSNVWLWQLPSGDVMTVLTGHTMPVTAGVFPPPLGRQLLTASLDSTLILWNPSASAPMFKLGVFHSSSDMADPAEHGITALAVSPNGSLAAVGSASGKVKLVSLPKGEIVGSLEGHTEGESIEALAFVDVLGGAGGGKGVVLVSGATDGKGFVWDCATGRVRAELQHDEPITSLAPHPAPNVHLVTSGSADRTLKTWDVRNGSLIGHHKGHAGVINGVVVTPALAGEPSPAGLPASQLIMSAGDEGVSLMWRV